MRIKKRLDKIARRVQQSYLTLTLPDGTIIRYTPEDSIEAFCASVDDEEHWLLPYFREADANKGMPAVIRALEASGESNEC